MGTENKNSPFVEGNARLFVQGYAVMEGSGDVVAVVSNRSAGKDGKSQLANEAQLLQGIDHVEKGTYLSPAQSKDVGKDVQWMAKLGIPVDAGRDNLMTLRAALDNIHSIESDPAKKASLQSLKSENDVNQFVTLDGRRLGDLPEGNQPHDKSRIEGTAVSNTLPVMPLKLQ